MLTLLGPASSARHCDGVSRRDFLRIGAVGLGGLSLPQLLAIEQAQADSQPTRAVGKRHKSLIMIFLCGGPPHQDMYDIKDDAPAEIRGEFKAIPTAVPGIGRFLPGCMRRQQFSQSRCVSLLSRHS